MDNSSPPGRYFRGNIQRFLVHESSHGFKYHAAELSIGAPAGLSGGPVLLVGQVALLVGVVAENYESSTYLRTLEEFSEPGKEYREKVHSVINYAMAVCLLPHESWLLREIEGY